MSLPFTHEQFLDVFGAYNSALWPAAVALWLVTAAAVVSFVGRPMSSRLLAGLLAIHWLWSGAVYHFGYFAAINPAARIFGTVFLIQAGLFAWLGIVRRRLEFVWGRGRGLRGGLAAFFMVYALAYPFLVLATGLHWPRMPSFGVPCPTTLLTVGFLLSLPPASMRGLSVIPLAWSVVGGSAAIVLGVLPDFALLLAVAVLLTKVLVPRLLTGLGAFR